jgi:hypothetical protein
VRLPVVIAGVALAAATLVPIRRTAAGLLTAHAPSGPALAWLAADAASEGSADGVLAPPYYAALAGRRLRHDYADWTVWGMRAAAGVEPEAGHARTLVAQLQDGSVPSVVADFRLGYIPGALEALAAAYVASGSDGAPPDRAATLWRPEGSTRGTQ